MGSVVSCLAAGDFKQDFALEVLESIAFEDGCERITYRFSEKYLRELLTQEATLNCGSPDMELAGEYISSIDYISTARKSLVKLRACEDSFEKLKCNVANMDKSLFANLMLGGSFHVSSGTPCCSDGKIVFIRSGLLQNDTWRISSEKSPVFDAHIVSFLWGILAAQAQCSGYENGAGTCRVHAILSEEERGTKYDFPLAIPCVEFSASALRHVTVNTPVI